MNILKLRSSLSFKFLAPIVIGLVLGLSIGASMLYRNVASLSSHQSSYAKQALLVEQKSAEKALIAALNSKADTIGRFMAKTAPDLILSYDFASLKSYQKEATADNDVAYTAYLKPDGSPMTSYKKPADTSGIIERRYPIISGGDKLGFVLIGMSKKSIEKGIAESNQRIKEAITDVATRADSQMKHFSLIMLIISLGLIVVSITILVSLFRKFIINPLDATSTLIDELARGGGDLTVVLPTKSKDEISQLAEAVNKFVATLRGMIETIAHETQSLTSSSSSLSVFSGEQSGRSERQTQETHLVVTAIEEMSSTVKEVARNAASAASAASEADNAAIQGKNVVNTTIESINSLASEVENAAEVIDQLRSDSETIGTVLDVIRDIADQTNLLALNAAIEAARAGEQGRGFAVVADEVRSLASRTRESTQEINNMIERLQTRSSNAVEVMAHSRDRAVATVEQAALAGESLQSITQAVNSINEMNILIASAAEEQSSVADEISKNVVNINDLTTESVGATQKISHESQSLSDLAQRLQDLVSQFKTA